MKSCLKLSDFNHIHKDTIAVAVAKAGGDEPEL